MHKNIIPILSTMEKQEMLAYFTVYEKYHEKISEQATQDLIDHPMFGILIRDIPKEVSLKRSKLSLKLQKDAILNDNWQPYVLDLNEQGITYAKMGLDFKSWYELVLLVKNYLTPYLHIEYGNSAEVLSAFHGMNRFMDIAMSILGEAYLEERNAIIKQDQEHLSSIYNTTADMIFVLDVEENENYRFSSINQSFQSFFGISYNEIVGKTVFDIVPQESLKPLLKKYKEAIEGKQIVRWEHNFQNHTEILIGELSIAPLFDEKGNCIRLVGGLHNITDLKRAEAHVIEMNEELEAKVTERTIQLEAAIKELEGFNYSVSHDLRAPLRAVNGYAEILKEDYESKLDEEGKRLIESITYNSTKMGILIDDLLAFSQLGYKEIQKSEVDMNNLLKDVMIDINKSISHKAKISISKLHPVQIDYKLLHQVMFNLISNAIKYSSKVKNSMVEIFSKEEDGEIIFSVKDNGAGFDMQYVDKLFGVFQRLHSPEEFEGTGVGLAIVRRIITKHGGKVWANGKVNEGSVFNFSLKT